MSTATRPSHLVVVLAPQPSSSLGALLSSLPKGLDASVVITPERDGAAFAALKNVHGLLDLPAERPLARGVYLAPAKPLEVSEGRISVRTDGEPAVERFVESAAEAYGERLILVLLSGSGTAAVEAAIAVGNNDGTLIVEKPRSGQRPVPPALPPTSIDVFSEPENVGEVLAELVREDVTIEGEEAKLVETLLDRIRDRHGIDFTSYKLPTIRRRLDRRMAAVGAGRLADYLHYLGSHPEEYQRLISSFLIKVTDFFRDQALFDHIRDRILPDLVRGARAHGHEIRIWSAGCATGEEAYSIAILVAEVLGDERKDFNVRIFATDVDADAIAFARQGVYPATSLRKLPRAMIQRYFLPRDGEFELNKTIRGLVVFGQHDLAERAPFPRVDMIVCRNVLIYFTEELQMRTLQLFAFALRDNGFLVLGNAESTNPLPQQFTQEDSHLKVYRRHGERILIPPPRRRREPGGMARAEHQRRPALGLAADHADHARRVASVLDRADRLLVNLPVGIVVVDRQYDVQHINAAARRLLGIRTAGIGDDFVHLATVLPPAELRAALDSALRGQAATRTFTVDGESAARHLELAAHPGYVEGIEGGETAVVIITDVTDSIGVRDELERMRGEQRGEIVELQRRVEQLQEANRQLIEANEDLALANMDLRTTNDELQVSNEEVQAASEEVETLNEELQATNEELETLNEELQATVEELNTTNDDLQERGRQLEEMARGLDMADAEGRSFEPGEAPWAKAARGEAWDGEVTIGRGGMRRKVRITIARE